jgi:kynurenine formamidase
VLVHTGRDRYRGSERYGTDHPFPTAVAADWLAEQQIALADINSAADRRVPAREPGAGQITESDVEPGQPCDRIADFAPPMAGTSDSDDRAQIVHVGA